MGRYVSSVIYHILLNLCSIRIKGTYFNVGLGACGEFDTDDDAIVAISADLYGDGSYCNRVRNYTSISSYRRAYLYTK